jgi:hypothetical protein
MNKTCLALMMSLVAAIGCSNSSNDATVQGTVTIDGVLATRGTVSFHPVDKGPLSVGQIHPDGSYALRTGAGNTIDPDAAKIPAGEYVVTVMVMGDSPDVAAKDDGSPPAAGPRLTAIKYAHKETSGLSYTVKPGRNVFALELVGAGSDPPPEPESDEEETDETVDTSESSNKEESSEENQPAPETSAGDENQSTEATP